MEPLSWRSWPMVLHPLRAAVAIGFVVLTAWFLQTWLNAGYFTIVAVALVWGQVAGFFLPTRYELTEETVSVKGVVSKREKRWSDFRSYSVDEDGVLLSPFEEPSRLARFRGLSLQFHDNREEVIEFVRKMVERRRETDADVGDEGQEQ
ncbi:MAG: hypothetical protein GF400_07930 [Candidatus Eisenbacteria bacterium]|nr:hypothetical protein [Candidatus Eisenbacteria bacterium]